VTIKNNQTTVQLEIGKRILVVDDEPDVCFVLEMVLDENGFVVDSYEDPFLALERFRAHLYNLVILDIKMPELNGFALYEEIRRLDKKVKVCFLTAGEMYYGVYSDIFSSLPANHFIKKPIDNEELMKRINEIASNIASTRAASSSYAKCYLG
jgi:DNA-binding response OmpR family regulator